MKDSIYVDADAVIIHHEPTITSGKVIDRQSGMVTFETNNNCMITMYGYIVDGTSCLFCLHNDKGPAWICEDLRYTLIPKTYSFYVHGERVMIHEITDDALLKLILEIKWGHLKLEHKDMKIYV